MDTITEKLFRLSSSSSPFSVIEFSFSKLSIHTLGNEKDMDGDYKILACKSENYIDGYNDSIGFHILSYPIEGLSFDLDLELEFLASKRLGKYRIFPKKVESIKSAWIDFSISGSVIFDLKMDIDGKKSMTCLDYSALNGVNKLPIYNIFDLLAYLNEQLS